MSPIRGVTGITQEGRGVIEPIIMLCYRVGRRSGRLDTHIEIGPRTVAGNAGDPVVIGPKPGQGHEVEIVPGLVIVPPLTHPLNDHRQGGSPAEFGKMNISRAGALPKFSEKDYLQGRNITKIWTRSNPAGCVRPGSSSKAIGIAES